MELYGDVEKIIEKILERARKEAERIKKEAEEKCREIEERTEREIEEMRRKWERRISEEAEREYMKIVEGRRDYWRVEILKKKQEILEELKKALIEKLKELEEEDKEKYVLGILSKIEASGGEIIPSIGWEKAVKRVAKGFKVLKAKDLGGGFVVLLREGGERIDATITTMVENFWRERHTEIASKVFGVKGK